MTSSVHDAAREPRPHTTILEVGDDPAVGFAGRILASFGHRVIKLEMLPTGDSSRSVAPFYRAPDRTRPAGVLFHYLHHGKESIAIEPTDAETRGRVAALAAAADAVLVGWGGSPQLTVEDALAAARPSVLTVVSPFGTTGPRAGESAVAATIFASSGEASMLPGGLGFALNPDGPPLLAPSNVVDFDAGVIAALVSLAGLWRANDSGGRLMFDVSKQESETSLNRWLVSHYHASGWVESRATRAYAYGGLVECSDGFVMFQPTTDGHWAGLKKMLGHPLWAEGVELSSQEGRVEAGARIQEECRRWASCRTKAEIFEIALTCSVPIAPFRDMGEVAACAQFASRGFYVPYGPERLPGLPFGPAATASIPSESAPDLGQHTSSLIEELLASGEVPTLAVAEAPPPGDGA